MIKAKEGIYLVGSFTNPEWRDEFINKFPEIKWVDPRNNPQSSMAKVVFTDLNSSIETPSTLCYIPFGKNSAGTTSYSEVGASRVKGNSIITVDESGRNKKESLLKKVSSYYFFSKNESFNFLKRGDLSSKITEIVPLKNPSLMDSYKNVYVAGDLTPLTETVVKLKKMGKKINCNLKVDELDKFKETDLMIINFDKGNGYNKKEALYFMGVSYALNIPIILVDENPVNYPTLPAIARRTFHKEGRFEELNYYLDRLKSLKISDEALVYYDLMTHFNKPSNYKE
ncbi:MAG: hypothetical protein NUV46_03580 [Nanoarchaeota archaeon]|nr:hypothetical protein [Nanoarchaeota archaeon]